MFNFLLMAEETSGGGFGTTNIVILVVFALLIVFMIVSSIMQNRKQKKQAEEMQNKLTIGATITTIGGIVGKVTRIDEETGSLFIETGDETDKHILQIIKNAVYSVHADKVSDEYEEVTNEIK